VNRNYDHAFVHSPLLEFMDVSRPKICLLDDNFFACLQWKPLLMELKGTGKPFQFKQGLDERLLTEERCAMLFGSRYDGDYIFYDHLSFMFCYCLKSERTRENALLLSIKWLT